jgi:hypothetical protein
MLMLKTVTNITVFGTYLIVFGVFGFLLWQALFAPKQKMEGSNENQATQSEQQHTNKQALRAGTAPAAHNPTEQAIADYTQLLAIFTGLLVLATVALFVSGERNVDVAAQSARSAKDSAEAANKAADVAKSTLIASQRAWSLTK